MKRVFPYLLALIISFLFIGCEQEIDPIYVASVNLSDSTVEMVEGEKYTLTVTIEPSNADDKSVSWTSSQPSIASVQDGVVTAHKVGNATITVKSTDGEKTATCSISVRSRVIATTGVSLDKTSIELTEGDETILTATVTPDNATNKNVTWTSSDESIATVDNGKVTAIKEGATTITATTEDGGKTAKCAVIVLYDNSDDTIEFVDKVMKDVCVNAFDTNGDGELSYKEAAAVEDLRKMTLTQKTFKSFDEFQYFKNVLVVPESYFCNSDLASITFPESCKHIAKCAFKECYNLTTIILNENLQQIYEEAFASCYNLSNINIPDNVTHIGKRAFSGCNSLPTINISKKLNVLEEQVFLGCKKLDNIIIPDNIKDIKAEVFCSCENLSSIQLSNGPTFLLATFSYCTNLQNIKIPESVEKLYATFVNCINLKEIYIPNSVKEITNQAFQGCASLNSIDIPEGETYISNYLFFGCTALKSIKLPDSIVSIDRYAFGNCYSLSSISLPHNIKWIDDFAFISCINISEIYVKGKTPPKLGEYAFHDTPALKVIYVPIETLEDYRTATIWSNYKDIIVGYDYENNKVVE